jgi:hypothetical protein
MWVRARDRQTDGGDRERERERERERGKGERGRGGPSACETAQVASLICHANSEGLKVKCLKTDVHPLLAWELCDGFPELMWWPHSDVTSIHRHVYP